LFFLNRADNSAEKIAAKENNKQNTRKTFNKIARTLSNSSD